MKPLVSIVCIAYNHEPYIRECLESFVAQKVNFPIEILVNDDCSKDNTAVVIHEYEEKYPNIFRCVYQKENQYSKGVHPWFDILFPMARGKYIALCEGDDYWIDSYKLQRQVDYMEQQPECVMCCSNAYQEFDEHRHIFVNADKPADYLQLSDVLDKWAIPTASIVFRKDALTRVDCSKAYPNDDYALELRLMSQGKIYYDPLVTSVYRMHGDSVSADMNRHKVKSWRDLIELLSDMKELYSVEQHYLFDEAIARYEAMIKDHIRSTHPVKKWFYRKTYTRAIKRLLRRIAR